MLTIKREREREKIYINNDITQLSTCEILQFYYYYYFTFFRLSKKVYFETNVKSNSDDNILHRER